MTEFILQTNHNVRSMRRTFKELSINAKIDPKTKILTVEGREIGFVYYRTGYQLNHYQKENERQGTEEGEWDESKWQIRTLLECSMAIKCPSIDVHLTTFKKFQEAFGQEKVLLDVLNGDQKAMHGVKGLFKGLYSLEDLGKEGAPINDIIEKALKNPHDYVLKP